MDSAPDYLTVSLSSQQHVSLQHQDPISDSLMLHGFSSDNNSSQSSAEPLVEDPHPFQPSSAGQNTVAAKIGTRFSTKALRSLKAWFATHEHHPYPRTRDLESLELQTGLNKQQISTWLANTRRRTKSRIPIRPTSPSLSSSTRGPLQIPPPHPSSSIEQMDPLRRWENSPPEDEAADATAILNAMSEAPGVSERPNLMTAPRPQPSVWGEWSSASSAGTSNSSHSSGGSAYSQRSASSRGSAHGLRGRAKQKRRRNRTAIAGARQTKLSQVPRKFQCTFCTETFAQKHGWQRHEKSLHLSLEKWECSPEGPYKQDGNGYRMCVYCDESEPDENHLSTHNYQVCLDRPAEERSFHRKDHLIQHLKAVHHVAFESLSMGHWKRTMQDVRSCCGFCGVVMASWAERADHLADHFKSGATMIDWLGDWGFEDDVVEMVQNSIPPYLIDFERNSPWPFTTDRGPPATPASAFELIKMELDSITSVSDGNGSLPSPEDLQYEGCCIIIGSEMLSPAQEVSSRPRSWLQELVMSSDNMTRQVRNMPMKSLLKGRVTELRINGKANIFDSCSLEERLHTFVRLCRSLGSPIEDSDLQREACQIVETTDAESKQPSASFVNLLTSLIHGSTHWLESFRRRAGLPVLGDQAEVVAGTLNANERQEFAVSAVSVLNDPKGSMPTSAPCAIAEPVPEFDESSLGQQEPSVGVVGQQQFTFLSTDTFYWGLRRGLSRFVATTTSPTNPERHIPTDEELQCQARWIMFDSDDTWDQTPADNAEWLMQFKRDNGLVPEYEGQM